MKKRGVSLDRHVSLRSIRRISGVDWRSFETGHAELVDFQRDRRREKYLSKRGASNELIRKTGRDIIRPPSSLVSPNGKSLSLDRSLSQHVRTSSSSTSSSISTLERPIAELLAFIFLPSVIV